jgi:predicted O-linked N-acetylglucosamine transferase (SPINDLY family)
MDAFLADGTLAPPAAEQLFSERIIRLPRIPLVYQPPSGMPDVAAAPALPSGIVTFGYFGRPDRLNANVIAAWANILQQVKGSRLILNSAPFREAAFCDLFAARFAAHGVNRKQLVFIHTEPQTATWSAYGRVDIALDPFPHNAGTTTIEALWLGVPVISLAGRPSVGRFGAMILHALDLDDWITEDVANYTARAVKAADNIPGLVRLRQNLRPRFVRSPLRDAVGLARHVEAAYRMLADSWRTGSAVARAEP